MKKIFISKYFIAMNYPKTPKYLLFALSFFNIYCLSKVLRKIASTGYAIKNNDGNH
jgi:hypothetical protein